MSTYSYIPNNNPETRTLKDTFNDTLRVVHDAIPSTPDTAFETLSPGERDQWLKVSENYLDKIGLNQTPDSSFLRWRMRSPFTLPASWLEVGLFVGIAAAIQVAYSLIWDVGDVENDEEFPAEKINPLKRQDMVILEKTFELNEMFIAQQQNEMRDQQRLEDLFVQNGIDQAQIEQLRGDFESWEE